MGFHWLAPVVAVAVLASGMSPPAWGNLAGPLANHAPTVTHVTPLPSGSKPAALSPGSTSIYGADLLTRFSVYDNPTYASWDSRDDYLFITNFGSPSLGGNTVTIVAASNNTPLVTYPVGDDPINSGYDPATGLDYVLNFGTTCNATVFNGTRLVGSLAVGCGPHSATYDPANGWMYISNFNSNTVAVVDDMTIVATLPLSLLGQPSPRPGFGVYDAADRYVYVPDSGDNNVSILNGTQFVTNLSVGQSPQSAVYDPATAEVYILNAASNNVTILKGTRVVGNAPAGGGPTFGTYDAANGYVYVGDQTSDSVFVLSGTTEVGNVSVGHFPQYPTYDSVDHLVYFPVALYNGVAVLNGTSLVARVATGVTPYSALFDPATTEVYVCDYGSVSDNISVLGTPNGSYPLTFHEHGLPSGENWTVGLGATNFSAHAPSSFVVPEPNGSYPYTVPPVRGYIPVAPTGTATVTGAPVSINVSYSAVYPIDFNETGLPAGTPWSVAIANSTLSSSGSSIVVNLTNGTYTYAIGPEPGYSTTFGGTVHLAGGPALVSVTFVRETYLVVFFELGLPLGTSWSAAVNGTTNSSSTRSIGFQLPNGTYRFTIAAVPGFLPIPPNGTFAVNGSNLPVPLRFVPVYPVDFTESGLPPSSAWTVRISGLSNTSTGPTVGFALLNGSYNYTITTGLSGYSATPPKGTFNVSGGAVALTVKFEPSSANASYAVSFVETGLPSGTAWTVHLGARANSSTGSTVGFRVPNGTYTYSFTAAGYAATPSSGRMVVDGPGSVPGPVSVSFRSTSGPPPRYAVSFVESGLPSSTLWGVVIQGVTNTTTAASLVLQLPDGPYTFALALVPGFSSTSAGSFQVSGAPRSIPIAFTPVTYTVTLLETGLPNGTEWEVTFGTTTINGTASTLTAVEPNGTYSYSVAPVAGYGSSGSGSVRVDGRNLTLPTFTFTKTGSTPSTGALPLVDLGLLAAVAVVVIVGVVVLWRSRRDAGPETSPEDQPPMEYTEPEEPDPGDGSEPPG